MRRRRVHRAKVWRWVGRPDRAAMTGPAAVAQCFWFGALRADLMVTQTSKWDLIHRRPRDERARRSDIRHAKVRHALDAEVREEARLVLGRHLIERRVDLDRRRVVDVRVVRVVSWGRRRSRRQRPWRWTWRNGRGDRGSRRRRNWRRCTPRQGRGRGQRDRRCRSGRIVRRQRPSRRYGTRVLARTSYDHFERVHGRRHDRSLKLRRDGPAA